MILSVRNLNVYSKEGKNFKKIINNISFDVKKNKCLGILGESGSGKSMTCKAVMGLLDNNFAVSGEIVFKGQDILNIDKKEREKLSGKSICMIIQNPMTAFNPLFTIGNTVRETFKQHLSITKEESNKLAEESFKKMNLNNPEEIMKKYPHELSGGMLQRIMIAITIALEPDLIIADEPTTAIDCLNVVEVIKEFQQMKEILKTSMIFISHDLSVLSAVSDEIMVMKSGEILEHGNREDILNDSKHEHTNYLIDTRMKLLKRFKEAVK